ncbi:hypothetical protein DAERI_090036 [Deinococcus aerius]|uniref:Uncharacterized protein n=1 Tax=Deinococcus aerius TaxID=200253 RepID=A0A2I9D7J1_9DEIO|nr:hypothetical protein [Deinococcus aerius]GBF06450.1 hypothetical protein DAERI_090036 [Deinococcus aerius]
MNLEEALKAVHDRQTFLAFVDALLTAAVRDGGDSEINPRTATFLEAALAATADYEGGVDFLEQPSWKGFATFLHLGLIYE